MRNFVVEGQEVSGLQASSSTTVQSLSSSEIHIWRMRIAVLWSIILQFVMLFLFILCVNVDLFHPLSWLGSCFRVFLSFGVFLKLVVLVIIIYIQGEVCKKDYVTGPVYHTTRFQKIRNFFCFRNLLLLLLHMVIGITIFWIYSSVSGREYQYFARKCNGNSSIRDPELCLVESKLFLLIGGLWSGVYYFANDYMFGSRSLSFPLIQQYKFYRVKAALRENIKHSVKNSVLPTCIFVFLYYFYGGFMRTRLMEILSYKVDSETIDSIKGLMNIQLIFSLWLFSCIFIIGLQMMELLFNVHLTEHCVFPISTAMLPPGNYMSLTDSLKTSNIPILYHLGHLDLFTLSTKCQQRREDIFTLSHPGGHPHSWNAIFKECTSLIKMFSSNLNGALNQAPSSEKEETKTEPKPEVSSLQFHSHSMRRLVSPQSDKDQGLSNARPIEYQSGVEIAFNSFQHWWNQKWVQFFRKPYVAYFFAESCDSRINYLLCQCQPVIWAVQSLAFLSAASLKEDRYGIVQRDLSDIIVSIVNLKQVIDKLFKQNLIVKKSFYNDPVEVQMKYLLRTSVKRSLYKVAVSFGPYLRDLRLPVEVVVQMNNFVSFKEV